MMRNSTILDCSNGLVLFSRLLILDVVTSGNDLLSISSPYAFGGGTASHSHLSASSPATLTAVGLVALSPNFRPCSSLSTSIAISSIIPALSTSVGS